MSGVIKIGLTILLAFIAFRIVVGVAVTILNLIVPLAIVAGIAFLLYGLINSKCSSGRGSIFR